MTTKPLAADNDNHHDFYVYAWLRQNGEPFYIGKGRRRRDKCFKSGNVIFGRIVAKMRGAGHEPKIVRLKENLQECEALAEEITLIAKFGRIDKGTGILANRTDGGEGQAGVIAKPESVEKRASKLRGRPLSEEHRQKIRIASIGKVISAEQREKLRLANIGKKTRPETVERIRNALIGRTTSAEAIAKRVAKTTGQKRDHVSRENMRRAQHLSAPRSGYKGVFVSEKRWRARISVDGKRTNLGSFPTPEDAARAYDRAAYAAWGSDCYLNFPDELNGNAVANN